MLRQIVTTSPFSQNVEEISIDSMPFYCYQICFNNFKTFSQILKQPKTGMPILNSRPSLLLKNWNFHFCEKCQNHFCLLKSFESQDGQIKTFSKSGFSKKSQNNFLNPLLLLLKFWSTMVTFGNSIFYKFYISITNSRII